MFIKQIKKHLKESVSRYWKKVLTSILVLIIAPIIVLFVYDKWQLWRSQRGVELGFALYLYEKNVEVYEKGNRCFWEMRNLVTDCSLYKVFVDVDPGCFNCPDPAQLLLIKIRIQNKSSISISDLRLGLTGLGVDFERTFCTPNSISSLSIIKGTNDAISTHVVTIERIAPKDTIIVTLEKATNNVTIQRNL